MYDFLVNHVLGHLPTWIWPFITGIGVCGIVFAGVIAKVPQFAPYALFVKPVAIAIVVVGVFMSGAASVTSVLKQDLVAAEQRAAVAEQAAKDANTQLSAALAKNDQLVASNKNNVAAAIKANKAAIDAQCKTLDDNTWALYNRAILNKGTK